MLYIYYLQAYGLDMCLTGNPHGAVSDYGRLCQTVEIRIFGILYGAQNISYCGCDMINV